MRLFTVLLLLICVQVIDAQVLNQSALPLTLKSQIEGEQFEFSLDHVPSESENLGGVCNLISHQVVTLDDCWINQDGISFPLMGVSVEYQGDCDDLTFYVAIVGQEFVPVVAGSEVASGQILELIPTPYVQYELYWSNGTQETTHIIYSTRPCSSGGILGCTDTYADNYNSSATAEDGSCAGQDICDCSGTRHTYGVLSFLGNNYPESGDFNWEGQAVDFDCPEWAYECGDLNGSPDFDPFGVCTGGFPPNRGCTDTCEGDLNGDGVVNVEDFVLFNSQFGVICD